MNRLPTWFRQDIPDEHTKKIAHLLAELGVKTVCQEAKCPNITYCFSNKRVTFIILGNTCTRSCKFCNIKTGGTFASPLEPSLISRAVKILGLNYVVITSVTRDDLVDGGASVFAETLRFIHKLNSDIKVEVLIPDLQGIISSLQYILNANAYVLAHNIETVKRLYRELRPQSDYGISLRILKQAKELRNEIYTKSSIMLGLGEKREEVISAMQDLKSNKCDILTLGQYLAPSVKHYPVKEFINIEQFQEYKEIGIAMGFKAVVSGPRVRSSYHAEQVSKEFLYV
jgi:lipoyl synthase